MNQKRIIRILKKISNSKNVEFVKKIDGGMSNETFLYQVSSDKYVVHISTKGYSLFVDRKAEINAFDVLKENELIQHPIYYKNKIRIFKYIDGISLNSKDNIDEYYDLISKTAHSIHSSKLFKYDYKPFEYIAKYLENNITYDDLLYKSIKILYDNKDLLESRKLYPCHNDMQLSNLIYKDNKVYLIDFEFAKNNDYLFDIAAFGNNGFDKSLELLKHYNKDYTDLDIYILKLWRIYLNSLWYLIAYKKHLLKYDKVLNMDFREVGLYFLNNNDELIKSL